MLAISPTEAQIQGALRAFCLNVLPAGVDVVELQNNRVPEPHAANFVDMVPLRRTIVATNVHEKLDIYEAGQVQTVGQYECVLQLGFHAADNSSGDMAQLIAQMIRDPYGVAFINGQNSAVTPLYAGQPRQVPYINAEDQYEFRWIVECVLQANITITGLPQQFITSAELTLIDVDAVYPP